MTHNSAVMNCLMSKRSHRDKPCWHTRHIDPRTVALCSPCVIIANKDILLVQFIIEMKFLNVYTVKNLFENLILIFPNIIQIQPSKCHSVENCNSTLHRHSRTRLSSFAFSKNIHLRSKICNVKLLFAELTYRDHLFFHTSVALQQTFHDSSGKLQFYRLCISHVLKKALFSL